MARNRPGRPMRRQDRHQPPDRSRPTYDDIDSYRPQYHDPDFPPPPADMYQFRGNADAYRRNNDRPVNNRPSHEFQFRTKSKIAERPLLRARDDNREEQVFESGAQTKFRNLDELTDSDEVEMQDSDVDEDTRPTKRMRTETDVTDKETPKWCNPDPYTALPPPPETTGKKLDFISLIRKARIESVKPATQADVQDFISFGADNDMAGNDSAAPADAPTGPRSHYKARQPDAITTPGWHAALRAAPHKNHLREYVGTSGKHLYINDAEIQDSWLAGPDNNTFEARTVPQNKITEYVDTSGKSLFIPDKDIQVSWLFGPDKNTKLATNADTQNNISFSTDKDSADTPTGPRSQVEPQISRKRRREDDSTSRIVNKKGRNTSYYTNAMILDDWRADPDTNATPWLRSFGDTTAGVALHKEILDFYHWVKPQDHENAVRADVIQRLSRALNRLEPGELKAFGSYGAGLYLPTGDMDLVYLTRSFRGARGVIQNVNKPLGGYAMRNFLSFIRQQNLAQPGSLQPIFGAKVPIIKFVERVSGLKVDLSFNNDTGLAAIETFQKWRHQYPAMPMIVSVIKQYLMIRGLNDVAVGGLGGFSIICLVTSLVQHMPMTGPAQNLGDILLEFFNLYGNHFDRDAVAIRLDPPGYVDKKTYARNLANSDKKGRLTIIDPNRADNNISGGTNEIQLIMRSFSEAYDTLQERLIDYNECDNTRFSFLETLIGGDFDAYAKQRDILRQLYQGVSGQMAPAIIPPPPPPISQHVPPPPPPMDKQPTQPAKAKQNTLPAQTDTTPVATPTNGNALTKSQRRAIRLKELRPDLASKVPSKIDVVAARRLGGYKDTEAMHKDLARLEKEAHRLKIK